MSVHRLGREAVPTSAPLVGDARGVPFAPFGEEHMGLLRPLPEDPRARRANVDRWLAVAWNPLESWSRGLLGGRFGEDRVREAFQFSFVRLSAWIERGGLCRPADRSEVGRVRNFWKCRHLDWMRAERRGTETGGRRGVPADANGRRGPGSRTRASDERLREVFERMGERWPELPVDPALLLAVACEEAPERVREHHVAAARAHSGPRSRGGWGSVWDGVTRDAGEAWRLLRPWLAETASPRGRVRGRRLELAFALRGPRGLLDARAWDGEAARAGLAWLYNARRRVKVDLGLDSEGGMPYGVRKLCGLLEGGHGGAER